MRFAISVDYEGAFAIGAEGATELSCQGGEDLVVVGDLSSNRTCLEVQLYLVFDLEVFRKSDEVA